MCYQMMEGMGCLQLNDLVLVCLGPKLRPNISLGASPASFSPASLATIAALSFMWSMSFVSVHSFWHSCSLLCFDFISMPHFWNIASLSFVVSFFSIRLLSISRSRCRAFGLLKEPLVKEPHKEESSTVFMYLTLMEPRLSHLCFLFSGKKAGDALPPCTLHPTDLLWIAGKSSFCGQEECGTRPRARWFVFSSSRTGPSNLHHFLPS